MTLLFLDLETYSECDLRKAGAQKYARHPSTEILLVQYAIDNGEPVVVDCTGRRQPADLVALLRDGRHTVVIHNSAFDRVVLEHVWGVAVPCERVLDTMVQAYEHALPGALDAVGDALGVDTAALKDPRGKALVRRFCMPLPKNTKLRRATAATHPSDWAAFVEYARQDIVAMRAVYAALPRWNFAIGHPEHRLWCLDQRMNDRGFAVDLALAHGAVRAAADQKVRLDADVAARTGGAVTSNGQRQALLDHIGGLPDLRASTVRTALAGQDITPGRRALLEGRLEATKTSTAKFGAALAVACDDSRIRGAMQFGGAARTMRWAGRLLQPQNFPRGSTEYSAAQYEALCGSITNGSIALCGDVMQSCSDALRGLIEAAPGCKLVAADLSNIEGRVISWLADEQWKLDAFADVDTNGGPDMYKRAYGKMYGVDPASVTKQQRQEVKVPELACGFGGSVGAFVTFAAGYGIDLNALAEKTHASLDTTTIKRAEELYAWSQKKHMTGDLPPRTWVAIRALVAVWRDAHPATAGLWSSCDTAFRSAVREPGVTFRAGSRLALRRDGAWMRMRLPSGRYICYLHPRIEEDDSLSYMGQNQTTRRWERERTYGGMLAQGATQATARDVFAHGLTLADAAGYTPVLTVHDELVAETPNAQEFTHAGLASLLATVPEWATGLPLAAEGFEATRYRK